METHKKSISILINVEKGVEEVNPKLRSKVRTSAFNLELNGAIQGVHLDDMLKTNDKHDNEHVRLK